MTAFTSSPPLSGVLIIDLSDESMVQAGRLLADLGATVLRIEALAGDEIRNRAPFVDGEPGLERALRHLLYNAGKLSVAANLDSREVWQLIDTMTNRADVVIAPLQKSALARIYFDHERFKNAHPQVGLIDV